MYWLPLCDPRDPVEKLVLILEYIKQGEQWPNIWGTDGGHCLCNENLKKYWFNLCDPRDPVEKKVVQSLEYVRQGEQWPNIWDTDGDYFLW